MPFGPDAMDWEEAGADWPNREASRSIRVRGTRWHTQRMGQGPMLLLVHGTGASTHSWRDVLPLVARRFDVLAMDLPGHGFTEAASRDDLSLPGMAAGIAALCHRLEFRPTIAVGHSAGAAILARATSTGGLAPDHIVSLNGALEPFAGAAGAMFQGLAKLLFVNPLTPRFLAWVARDEARVRRLLADTGSHLDERGIALYARLFRAPSHVAGTLAMMANWNLEGLTRELADLAAKLVLVVGSADGTVPPAQSTRIARETGARLVEWPGLGHLAHEERPDLLAGLLEELVAESPAARRTDEARCA